MLFLDYILITGAQIDPGHSEEKIIPLGPRNRTFLEGSISMLNHCCGWYITLLLTPRLKLPES